MHTHMNTRTHTCAHAYMYVHNVHFTHTRVLKHASHSRTYARVGCWRGRRRRSSRGVRRRGARSARSLGRPRRATLWMATSTDGWLTAWATTGAWGIMGAGGRCWSRQRGCCNKWEGECWPCLKDVGLPLLDQVSCRFCTSGPASEQSHLCSAATHAERWRQGPSIRPSHFTAP